MSTIMMCSKCGGAIVGSSTSYAGRRCTCGGGVATFSDPALTGTGHKYCNKCGKDVTHDRRMKDHLGRYWCYECGAADQMKKGQGVSMVCPDCKKHFRPTHMMKDGEQYVCENCYSERQKHPGFLGIGRKGKSADGAKLAKILLALVLCGVGAALIMGYVMGYLG